MISSIHITNIDLAIALGNINDFRMIYIQYHPKIMHDYLNDINGEKTALQRAVESKKPEMVSEILFYTKPELIDYNFFNSHSSSQPRESYSMYKTKTPRQLTDMLLSKSKNPDEKRRLERIKSLLIQNGAKPKTHLGFPVFKKNGVNQAIYRKTRKNK
jgi:hypothetical protein